uniref:Uncharacterized protein n=1 Tax=Ditylenchus dipsaci TaxID=166011 RepID=A0A915CVC3_9BILA
MFLFDAAVLDFKALSELELEKASRTKFSYLHHIRSQIHSLQGFARCGLWPVALCNAPFEAVCELVDDFNSCYSHLHVQHTSAPINKETL